MTPGDPKTSRLTHLSPSDRARFRVDMLRALYRLAATEPAENPPLVRAASLALEHIALLEAERDGLLSAALNLETLSTGPTQKLVRLALSRVEGEGLRASETALEKASRL